MKKIGNTDFANPEDIIEIRDKNQIIKAKVVIPDDAVHHKSLMKENYIEFSFNLDSYCDFLRGDYITWQNTHYSLRENVIPEEVNSQNFKYKLKFEAKEMFLQDAQFYYMRQNLKESNWSLTAKATTFIKLVVDAANQYFGGDYYKVGTIEPAETLFLNFNKVSILSGLTQIAEKFNGEWYISDGYINLVKKIIFGSEIDFESEVSVASINRSDGQGEKPYNRILAFGSTRNIPSNYRKTNPNEGVDAIYQKRLRLPEGKGDVIDLKPNMSPEEVIEGTVIFEEVYPKRIGTLSEVTIIEKEDEDKSSEKETKWNAYRFKDEGLIFKNEYLLPKTELRIVFQSGDMNGLNFAVKFNPEDKPENKPEAQIFEIIPNEDYGKSLPDDTLKPNKGDTYILYGFDIKLAGDQYVPEAEEELYKTAIEWGKNNLRDKSVYDCQTIMNHFAENEMDLEIGQKVKLIKNVGYGRNYLTQIGYNIGKHITNTITLSEGEYIASCSNCQFDNIQIDGDKFINSRKFKLTKESVVTLYAVWGNNVPVPQDQIKCKIEKGYEFTDWTPAPEDLDDGIRSSRIMGFEKQLQNKYNAKYTVGDNAAYSRLSDLQGQIDEIKFAGNIFQQKGGNGIYLIKQFDYTAPSEFNTYSAKAQNARFLNKQTGGTVEEDTLFQKNLQVQGLAISDVFQNSTFTAGQFGSGFQIKRDSNGQSYLETDNLLVRREALFTSITAGEFKSLNMGIIISLADITVSKVEDNGNTWRCYFNNDGGKIKNKFAVNDQAICRKEDNGKVRDYWSLVTSVGTDYIELSKTDKDGAGTPVNNDVIIQFGNRTDVNRQHAIVLSAYGSDAPSIKQYSCINSYDLTDKELTVISPQGNKFTGEFVIHTHGTTSPIYKDMGLFENGKVYYKNDRVSHLGSYWVCIVNNTIQIPNEDSVVWRKETAGATDINNAIDNIQLGGANLLPNSNFTHGIAGLESSQIKVDLVSEYEGKLLYGDNAIIMSAKSGIQDAFTGIFFNQRLKPNTTYTLSIWLKCAGDIIDTSSYIFLFDDNNTYEIKQAIPLSQPYQGFQKKSVSFTTNSDKLYFRLRFGFLRSESMDPAWLLINCLKLEEGNKASDWVAAQEDTKADINNAIDNIQMGGTNLFLNSRFKDMTGWGGEGITSWYATEASPFNSSCNILKWTGCGWYQRLKTYSLGEALEFFQKGITYTLSFYAKADTNINFNVGAENLSLKLFTLTSEWQHITYTFIGDGKASTIIFYGQDYWDVPKYMTQPKLEIGNKATDWSPAPEDTMADISNAIDKIQIGGTNLFYNSTFTKIQGWEGESILSWSATETSPFNSSCKILKWSGEGWYQRLKAYSWSETAQNFQEGITYTLSFYAKADTNLNINVGAENLSLKLFTLTSEWQRITYTFVGDGRATTIIFYGQGYWDVPKYMTQPKLEIGNKSTDWSAAPEDTDAKFAVVQSEFDSSLKVLKDRIESKVSRDDFNSLGDRVLNSESRIDQQADRIASTVNTVTAQGEKLQSYIKQTPEEIRMAVDKMQIGGVNLANDTEDIVIDGGRSLYYSCKRGDIYTISIESSEVQLSGLGTKMMVYSDMDGAAAYIPISTDKQTQTFTWNSDDRIMRLCASENWSGKTRIKKLKLEKGNKATDWSPAPEDVKKEAVEDIISSFSITENNITLGAKTIKLDGTTIAKAISAGELEVGPDPNDPSLKITKKGAFRVKEVAENSSFLIDSEKQLIWLKSMIKRNEYDEFNDDDKILQIMKIDAKSGVFLIENEKNERAQMTSQGVFANSAGISPWMGGAQMLASIVGLGKGSMENDDIYESTIGVVGVYGRANNKTENPAPAYGGYFDMLRANGLCLNTCAITRDTIITEHDVIIACYNEYRCKVTLPSAPYNGRTIYVRMVNNYPVDVVSSSANIMVQKKKQTTVYVGSRAGDGALFIWDGQLWLYNYIQA